MAQAVKEGKLLILGITQEQHPDRCRLLAQWKGFHWPILHDPINIMGAPVVPILVAIDEQGIVRDTKPRLATIETTFIRPAFTDATSSDEPPRLTPFLSPGQAHPDFDILHASAEKENLPRVWRALADALALWGGEKRVSAAIDAYTQASKLDPKDAVTLFRLGVCYRRRYDSVQRQAGDFQAAINLWSRAVNLDPNQYIWRRRVQQYGPRLDKPYSFYDWVNEAERVIAARGEKPVPLAVRPGGAEFAYPVKEFPAQARARSPDSEGKINRDKHGLIRAEVTVVPQGVRPGRATRIHVVLRPDAKQKAHWNNEAEPMRLWIDAPGGWQIDEPLLTWKAGKIAVTEEERSLDFEVKAPANAKGRIELRAYALYNVCDGGGRCWFLRLDIPIELQVREN